MSGTALGSADPRTERGTPGDHADTSVVVAERFVDAVGGVDYRAIFGALAPDVRLRYLIPSGPGELVGAADVAAKYFEWFGDADRLDVESAEVERIADRVSARYRFLLREREHWEVVEQHTFVDVDEEGRIAALDLLCSGFRPAGEGEVGTMSRAHRFDAGTLSCADGLAREFRRRILAIPLGHVLEVETVDPAAKEDLPPLARMMGHTVVSVEPSDGGRLLISVERGR
jgi:TusA-related sulfurtransferase